jgi:hypothetical protein
VQHCRWDKDSGLGITGKAVYGLIKMLANPSKRLGVLFENLPLAAKFPPFFSFYHSIL